MADYDLIIIGGGIGGSALAAVMARAGSKVLLLEKSAVYEDRVRGEWIAPWGVAETRRLGLYDLLMGAGSHHVTYHATFDETLPPEEVEAQFKAMPLSMFLPDVPGPLCIGHPRHCQTLFDEAGRSGAETLRDVSVDEVAFAPTPTVTWTLDGQTRASTARLIVGADGRTSSVRETAGIALHQDEPHHMFAGMLIEGAHDWDTDLQAIGTEDDFAFLAFPQGDGKVRIYGSFSLDQRRRFAGPDGRRAFLDAFRLRCAPRNEALVAGEPAGPLLAYFNNDAWADEPFAPGVVLVGDAAGWNDPIIGLGLSITYRDVRIVSDLLRANADWSAPGLFAPYADERAESLRRLRFTAALTSALDAEFGEAAKARRARYFAAKAANPMVGAHAFAVMAGPESLPPEVFTPEHRAMVLGEA